MKDAFWYFFVAGSLDRDEPAPWYFLGHALYRLEDYRIQPARVNQLVEDGDVVDLGNRHFEVLHLPGHSPGSIGLWEADTTTPIEAPARSVLPTPMENAPSAP